MLLLFMHLHSGKNIQPIGPPNPRSCTVSFLPREGPADQMDLRPGVVRTMADSSYRGDLRPYGFSGARESAIPHDGGIFF